MTKGSNLACFHKKSIFLCIQKRAILFILSTMLKWENEFPLQALIKLERLDPL